MPGVDYALLAEYVRPDQGIAHVIGAGIDTVHAPQVPTGHNIGLLARFTFTRNECGRPHRIEIIFQDADGQRLAKIDASITPQYPEDIPVGWPVGVLAGFNLGLPLPGYGIYSFEILVNDTSHKSIDFRVARPPDAGETPA
jgi:hypothetical protein